MSSLILPKEHQNPTLEANLAALFRRYPHEKARLESVLRKPAPAFQLPTIKLPAAPSKPPIRILLLLGIVNPLFLADLLNDQTVQQENFKVFIFENDPEFLAFCFQSADLTQIINYGKTEWFLYQTAASVRPALFRALKPEGVTSMMMNVQALTVAAPRSEEISNYYDQVPSLYDETMRHVLHNHGNLDDSLQGLVATMQNKDVLLNSQGILNLKDHYKGMTAIIVGAGPSVDKEIETIKKYNDRCVVIAADATLKPLMAAGIRVDFVTSIERLNAFQKPFFEGLTETTADLVAFPVVHPDVLALYPGQVRMVYRNYSFYAYFEKAYPRGILKCGGSTSHLGLRLAAYMGCRRVLLIGIDSCYEEKDGKYRSHCSGTGYKEWSEFVDIGEFVKSRRHLPPFKAINNAGKEVVTNLTYYQWAKEFSEELAYVGQTMDVKNCSQQGLAIDGVPCVSLEDSLKNLDPMLIEKPAASTAPMMNRSWDHKELRKNFDGWLRAAKDAIKEADDLLAADTISLQRFNAMIYLCQFRFLMDDIFVSFVIQCCALRFFELENRWWSLGIGYDQDLREKTEVLKARFELFAEVLERLNKIFEEKTDG